jgi:hypothetical protein
MRKKILGYRLLVLLVISVTIAASVSFAAVIVDNSYQVSVSPIHPDIELQQTGNASISSSINAYNTSDNVTYSSSHVNVVNESGVAYFSNRGSYPLVFSMNLVNYSGDKYVSQIVVYAISVNSSYFPIINMSFENGTLLTSHNYWVKVGLGRTVSIGERIIMVNDNAASSIIYIRMSIPFYIGSDAHSYVGSIYHLAISTEYGKFY